MRRMWESPVTGIALLAIAVLALTLACLGLVPGLPSLART